MIGESLLWAVFTVCAAMAAFFLPSHSSDLPARAVGVVCGLVAVTIVTFQIRFSRLRAARVLGPLLALAAVFALAFAAFDVSSWLWSLPLGAMGAGAIVWGYRERKSPLRWVRNLLGDETVFESNGIQFGASWLERTIGPLGVFEVSVLAQNLTTRTRRLRAALVNDGACDFESRSLEASLAPGAICRVKFRFRLKAKASRAQRFFVMLSGRGWGGVRVRQEPGHSYGRDDHLVADLLGAMSFAAGGVGIVHFGGAPVVKLNFRSDLLPPEVSQPVEVSVVWEPTPGELATAARL